MSPGLDLPEGGLNSPRALAHGEFRSLREGLDQDSPTYAACNVFITYHIARSTKIHEYVLNIDIYVPYKLQNFRPSTFLGNCLFIDQRLLHWLAADVLVSAAMTHCQATVSCDSTPKVGSKSKFEFELTFGKVPGLVE